MDAKRRMLAALTACVIAATVACSVATGSFAVAPHPTAAACSRQRAVSVVTCYYRAVVRRDYRAAFGYLAANATGQDGRKLTLRTFLRLARTLDNEGGPVTSFSIDVLPSLVVLTLDRQRVGPYHAHLRSE